MSNLLRLIRRTGQSLNGFADSFLRQNCVLCAADSGSLPLCLECIAELPLSPGCVCHRCALPIENAPENIQFCGRCLAHPPHFDRTLACYRYVFPVDKLIQALKYGGRLGLAPFFAERLAELASMHLFAEIKAEERSALIVPLPLSGKRLAERGFNQSLEIVRPFARTSGLPVDTQLLRRTRHGPAQAGLSLRARRNNIRGSFSCARHLAGETIILVDDVMTSGSTLDEAAKTLKKNGAGCVVALVVARTGR